MKKVLLIVIGLLGLVLMTSCGTKNDSANHEVSTTSEQVQSGPETIGDIRNLPGFIESGTSCTDQKFVIAYEADGIYYRAIADITKEQEETINEAYGSEDFEAKIKAATESLKVSKNENLSDSIPSQEEMDKWVGMTGEELMNDGFTVWGYDLQNMEFNMNKGPFSYIITFDGKITDISDANNYQELKPCRVKSVKFEGLGDATTIEEGQ